MAVTDPGFNPSGSAEITAIKEKANELAALIEAIPLGRRRKAIALDHLETAAMFAVKASAVGDH